MNPKLLSMCLLMVRAAMGFAALPGPARQPVTVDPNDPEKKRTIVSPEEREKLGLSPHTWSGVVDPEVYTRLDRLNKAVVDSTDRLKRGRDAKAFDTLQRIRFRDMVYVEVQLKNKDARHSVLASLKASEFHVHRILEKSAGLVGYASKEALDKLAKNPDVSGVCLDDKLLPEMAETIYRSDLPPAKPGEASNEPGVAEGKVDPNVYRAFALTDHVKVWVEGRTDSLPKPGDLPLDLLTRNEIRDQAERKFRDRVLSTLTADDFGLQAGVGAGMRGFVSKEGLQKLWKHADVVRVELPRLAQFK